MRTFFRGEIKGSAPACSSASDKANFPTSVAAARLAGRPSGCHGSGCDFRGPSSALTQEALRPQGRVPKARRAFAHFPEQHPGYPKSRVFTRGKSWGPSRCQQEGALLVKLLLSFSSVDTYRPFLRHVHR